MVEYIFYVVAIALVGFGGYKLYQRIEASKNRPGGKVKPGGSSGDPTQEK